MAADKKKTNKQESVRGGVTMTRSQLHRIVLEEILAMGRRLHEAPGDEDEEESGEGASPKKKAPPGLSDASSQKSSSQTRPAGEDSKAPKTRPASDKTPASQKPPTKPASVEVPDAPDPADDDISGEGDKEDPSGELNDELSGKTIQSVTQEPKSKMVAGAQEIVLTFNETTDPLRIIVTKTGVVRFFYKGALHNLV